MLETKINKLVDTGVIEYYAKFGGKGHPSWKEPSTDCSTWSWTGTPLSLDPNYTDTLIDKITYEEVDWLIRESSSVECQTSPSEYVRECKRWFDAQRS